MLLAISVGNSTTAVGLWQGQRWLARWQLATTDRRPADEYGVLLDGLFDLARQEPGAVSGVAIASVVPALTPTFVDLSRRMFGTTPLVVGPGVRTGMAVRYDPPAALGVDRLLGAIAARQAWGAPVVVVDFGTATTFNVVTSDGGFAGGAIAPGVQTAAEALVAAGARLRAVDLGSASDLLLVGRSTEQSLRSGVLHGFAGLVSGLLARIAQQLSERGEPPAPVVATGGMAGAMVPLLPVCRLAPGLVLDGLRLVYGLNAHDRDGRPA